LPKLGTGMPSETRLLLVPVHHLRNWPGAMNFAKPFASP
jgi:hypothetical protein